MRRRGDDGREMPHHDPYDDGAIDAFLTGTPRDGADAALSSFVDDVRTASEAVPPPSPALAAAIAAGGISSDEVQSIAPWRKFNMKIKGFLAGLSVAGKVALGVGVAAAATTGAGAAGVLPGPVQHAFAKATEAVTPFTPPDPGHHEGDGGRGDVAGGETTTTIAGDSTTTTVPRNEGGDNNGNGNGVVTPTTEKHSPDGTGDTTTTVATGDGHHGDGSGSGETSTTVGNGSGDGSGDHHGGDSNNPESLEIKCVRHASPASITCSWDGDTGSGHASFALLRITTVDGPGRVICTTVDGQECVDNTVTPGTGYGYRVISLAADGTTVTAHSNMFTIMCCGDGSTTTTTEPHGGDGGGGDGTTTTTEPHHEPTTTTVPHGDGTTTTTAPGEHH